MVFDVERNDGRPDSEVYRLTPRGEHRTMRVLDLAHDHEGRGLETYVHWPAKILAGPPRVWTNRTPRIPEISISLRGGARYL